MSDRPRLWWNDVCLMQGDDTDDLRTLREEMGAHGRGGGQIGPWVTSGAAGSQGREITFLFWHVAEMCTTGASCVLGAGSISQPAGCMARSARQPGSVVLCTSDDDDDTFDLPVVPAPAALHVGRPGVGVRWLPIRIHIRSVRAPATRRSAAAPATHRPTSSSWRHASTR